MTDPADPRIERMYRGDCAWSVIALATLWATILFVFIKVWTVCSDHQVMLALAGGAATLLILNTASIFALIGHYRADKFHLYGLDLFYLDATKQARQEVRDERR